MSVKRLALLVPLLVILARVPGWTQDFGCPTGQPVAPWPGPGFVPTLDCQGWVTTSHPIARSIITLPPAPEPVADPLAAVAQAIYSAIEYPAAGATYRSIGSLSGWALDCALGSYPPTIRIIETKPDGSMREVPTTYFYTPAGSRPDVQRTFAAACPAVLNAPDSHGGGLGPNDKFGWTIALQLPITEPGTHTITTLFEWPGQNHAGSSAVSVLIQ